MWCVLLVLPACSRGPETIEATGTIEVTEIDVGAMTAGRVVDLRVQEGDTVQPGDTIAILTRSELPGELEAARARVEVLRARVRQAERGPRTQEISAARSQLAGAEVELSVAQREVDRVGKLVQDSMAPPRELERSQGQLAAARSRRDSARETLALLTAGTREEEVAAARAELKAAEAGYAQVRATAAELSVISATGGVVQLRNYERGEIAPAGAPIVTLIDPNDLWVRIYVHQDALTRLKVGASVSLHADAVRARPFTARVIEISPRAEFIPRVALTERERADLVFGVKLRITDATAGLKPGMPVDVLIPASDQPNAR